MTSAGFLEFLLGSYLYLNRAPFQQHFFLQPHTWIMVIPQHSYAIVCLTLATHSIQWEGPGSLAFEVQKLGSQGCVWEWRGNQKTTELWWHTQRPTPFCPNIWQATQLARMLCTLLVPASEEMVVSLRYLHETSYSQRPYCHWLLDSEAEAQESYLWELLYAIGKSGSKTFLLYCPHPEKQRPL